MANGMKHFGLGIVIGLAALVSIASIASAKTVAEKGSGSDTFSTTFFSYDGAGFAVLVTGAGKDNLGGAFTLQNVTEWTPTSTSCTASDQSAGTTFDLVESDGVTTYKKGQVFYTAKGSTAGSQCVSNTSRVSTGSITYTVTGGTGKLAAATGSFTVTLSNVTLAAAGNPPGSGGLFGASQFTLSGAVTF